MENTMNANNRSHFVYVTYIRTTPAKLWEALTQQQFIHRYWFNFTVACAWKKGSPWKMTSPDGTLTDSGEILEIDPPRRMVIRWQHEWMPELRAEGPGRCTIELEPVGSAVKLSITHEIEQRDSKLITAVSGGWPSILSNLKSLLETGQIVLEDHPGH
jgi:uncharacterized protein YndB with AHSA1/START domain